MNGLIINDTIYDTVFSLSSGKFPVFILRYTDRYCNSRFQDIKKENKIVYKNILVQYNVFDWGIKKYETSYFFIINSNKTISNIYNRTVHSFPEMIVQTVTSGNSLTMFKRKCAEYLSRKTYSEISYITASLSSTKTIWYKYLLRIRNMPPKIKLNDTF